MFIEEVFRRGGCWLTPAAASIAVLCSLCLCPSASAHNPDTSYLRVTLGEEEVELRFTFDVFSLQRLAVLDTDGNFEVSRRELDAEAPAIFDYLREHVYFEIDMQESGLGRSGVPGWPSDAGEAVPLDRYHQELVHFPFLAAVRDMPEDFYVEFDVFGELSERHKVMATVINGARRDEIEFTMFEPDYLYDTGYRPTWWRRHGIRLMAGTAGGAVLVAGWVFLRVKRRATAIACR